MIFTTLSYIETRKTISTITNLETMLVLQWKMQSLRYYCYKYMALWLVSPIIKQLLDEVEHDIMNYQNWGLCYLPKPKAEADNTDTRFW